MPRSLTARFYRWVLGGPSEQPVTKAVVELLTAGIRHYHLAAAIPTYPKDRELCSIQVPVLALLGGRSVVHDVAAARRRARELIPGAEVHVWPGAGHALPVEFVDEVNTRILDFVQRHVE